MEFLREFCRPNPEKIWFSYFKKPFELPDLMAQSLLKLSYTALKNKQYVLERLPEDYQTSPEYSFIMKDKVVPYSLNRLSKINAAGHE